MKYSLQELFRGYQLHLYEFNWRRTVIKLPINLFRVLQLTFFWLRTGYSWHINWNLDFFIFEVLEKRIESFINLKRIGYPEQFKSLEEWNDRLDEILIKLKYLNEHDLIEEGYLDVYNQTMDLLKEHIPSMWD